MNKQIYQKIRDYEIRIRKAVTTQLQGNFQSVFKGSGLEFDEVRPYQYGDDVRHIDWNVSAKGHGTFVKTFREDREQSVFFILDVSASQQIGQKGQQKIDISREVCGVLALSAIREGSTVGLLCFSDTKEKYLKPGKGPKHGYLVVSTLYKLQPRSRQTNLNAALLAALGLIKRKSVVILISDFIDEGFDNHLKSMAIRHDLIAIHVGDQRERSFPPLGIIPLLDKESQKIIWVNTSTGDFRRRLTGFYQQRRQAVEEICRKNGANYLFLDTAEDFVPKLIKLFKIRNTERA